MSRGVLLIGVAALAGGVWSLLMNRAAQDTDPLLAPMIAESTGAFIALAILLSRFRVATPQWSVRSIWLLLLAGVCVFSVDYFTARAYAMRLPISVGAPIFLGGAILVTTVIGLMLGEAFSMKKLGGVLLVATGAVILGTVSE